MAGYDPEARPITEVIDLEAKQSAQPGPVGVGHSQIGGEVCLSRLIEGLSCG